MKIIGKTSSGFILESNKNEIYNLVGFYYHGETGAPNLDVGSEVDVASMYQQLYRIRESKGSLAKFAKELHGIADTLIVRDPIVNNLADKK